MEKLQDRREARGQKTRERILQASVTLLSAKGLDGYTAASLAREAAVSKGTLFHHFSSLDEVLFATLEWHVHEFNQALGKRPYDSVNALLMGIAETAVEAQQEQGPNFTRGLVSFSLKASYDPRFNTLLKSMIENHARHLGRQLAQLSGRKADDKLANALALQTMILGDGIGLYGLVLGEDERIGIAWQAHSKMVDRLLNDKESKS